MSYIILISIMIVSMLQYLLLQTSLVFTLLVLLLCVVGIIMQILQKKIPRLITYGGTVLCLILSCFFLILSGEHIKGIPDYNKTLNQTVSAIEKGNLAQAESLLTTAQETYGPDDLLTLTSVLAELEETDYAAALEQLETMEDKSNVAYYAMKEHILVHDTFHDHTGELENLYLEAANAFPGWVYMEKKAGITLITRGEYRTGAYWLERVTLDDDSDAEVWYYLGAADYYLSSYDASAQCFERALTIGVSEETREHILAYARQIQEVQS